MARNVLAFDFGASSGRGVLFTLDGGKLSYEEIHRFSNDPVYVNGSYHWDILRLLHEIKAGIVACKNAGHSFDAIGIDTWGVDYGLLDKDGRLLQNPYHYRDTRTDSITLSKAERKEIFSSTGIQFSFINTLFQYICSSKEPVFEVADTALFVPDLLNYFLTGEKKTEYTIASTSQMLNARTRDFDDELLEKFGLTNKFANIVMPGSIVGNLSDEICTELGISSVPVVAVASHDTASAVLAAPLSDPKSNIYISCGTWLLLGVQTDEPIINEQSYSHNYTNEGGAFETYRFLHNIMGTWIQQEMRRTLAKQGVEVSYDELEKASLSSKPFACMINPNDDSFSRPGNMIARINAFADKTNQPHPEGIGELNRTILEGLALECAKSVRAVEEMTGEKIEAIHMVGGGIKSKLLCQFIANAAQITVFAGPVEATSIGNALMQYTALGEVSSLDDARAIVRSSFDIKQYEPADAEMWAEAIMKYETLTK